jgi:hypothetical protein
MFSSWWIVATVGLQYVRTGSWTAPALSSQTCLPARYGRLSLLNILISNKKNFHFFLTKIKNHLVTMESVVVVVVVLLFMLLRCCGWSNVFSAGGVHDRPRLGGDTASFCPSSTHKISSGSKYKNYLDPQTAKSLMFQIDLPLLCGSRGRTDRFRLCPSSRTCVFCRVAPDNSTAVEQLSHRGECAANSRPCFPQYYRVRRKVCSLPGPDVLTHVPLIPTTPPPRSPSPSPQHVQTKKTATSRIRIGVPRLALAASTTVFAPNAL